jgi:phosphate-selective porin OprO and OprP
MSRQKIISFCLISLLFFSRGFSDDQPDATSHKVLERLDQLEREVKSLKQENEQLRQRIGLETKSDQAVVRAGGKESSIALGGLIQAQADFGDKGDTRFGSDSDRYYLRRARINTTGRFLENFDFKLELELSGTLSETSALRAQMTDGYINWNKLDWLNAKVGQFKTPFGYEQLYADPKLAMIERTLVNDRLTPGRQIGIQAGGDLLDKHLSYATGIFNGTGLNNSFNDDDDFMIVQRVSGIPWEGKLLGQEAKWTAGGNAFFSDDASLTGQPTEFGFDSVAGGTVDNTFVGRRVGVGVDTQLRIGPFDLWAEYLRNTFMPKNNITRNHFDSDGWYVQGAYFIVPKRLQGVVKFDTFDPNNQVAGDSTDTWTFGLNYLIKGDDLKLQINYLRMDAAGMPDDQSKIILRMQAIF